MARKSRTPWCAVVVAALLGIADANASKVQIDINTASFGLSGSWDLAFDFSNGNPQPSSVTISGFEINGAGGGLNGSPTTFGNVTGVLPADVTLWDDAPPFSFNEYLQNATLADSIRFIFETTGTQEAAAEPDAFSFFLLYPDGSAYPTSDPTGAFFVYSIGNDEQPSVFQPEGCPQDEECITARQLPTSVPEPNALALAISGLFALGFMRLVRTSPRRAMMPTA